MKPAINVAIQNWKSDFYFSNTDLGSSQFACNNLQEDRTRQERWTDALGDSGTSSGWVWYYQDWVLLYQSSPLLGLECVARRWCWYNTQTLL